MRPEAVCPTLWQRALMPLRRVTADLAFSGFSELSLIHKFPLCSRSIYIVSQKNLLLINKLKVEVRLVLISILYTPLRLFKNRCYTKSYRFPYIKHALIEV